MAEGANAFTIAAPTPPSTSTTSPPAPTTTSSDTASTTLPASSTTVTTGSPATPPPGGPPPSGTPPGTPGEPGSGGESGGSLWEAPLRWLNYLGAAILVGAAVFLFVVGRPASEGHNVPRALIEILRTPVRVAGVVLLFSSLALILVQAAYAADVGLGQALGQPVWDVLGTYSGRVWIARIALVLVVLVAGWTMSPRLEDRRWWVILAGGLGILLTFSLVSHASTDQHATLSIAVDWVHLVAMTAWIGGLVALTAEMIALRRSSGAADAQARMMRRFSGLAVTCVVLLAVTGLYGATRHFAAVDPLFTTTYGRVLLVKLALFGVLLLFGAANKLVLIPRLAVPGAGGRALMYTVPSEVAVGTVLLFVGGVLTSIAPG